MYARSRQAGISLIELIMFIIIVGVGVAGVLTAFNVSVRGSADPMVRKQAIAIAESLLLEIEQKAFGWCDPQDANVLTATSAADCATTAEGPGPEAAFGTQAHAETRYQNLNGGDSPFDNVNDYNGFAMPDANCAGICNAQDSTTPIAALAGYATSVVVADAGGVAPFAALPAGAVLRIAVNVTGRGENITLVGYRFRYAPNAPG